MFNFIRNLIDGYKHASRIRNERRYVIEAYIRSLSDEEQEQWRREPAEEREKIVRGVIHFFETACRGEYSVFLEHRPPREKYRMIRDRHPSQRK